MVKQHHHTFPLNSTIDRRKFLATSTALGEGRALQAKSLPTMLGKAEYCTFIWLGDGMGQLDTFEPKSKENSNGKDKKDDSIETNVRGVRVAEHLPQTAKLMDRNTM